jgi:hypothetical protein
MRCELPLRVRIVFRGAVQPGYISSTKSHSTHTRTGSSVVFLPRPIVRNIPSDFIAWDVPSKTCWQETTPPAIQSSVLLLAWSPVPSRCSLLCRLGVVFSTQVRLTHASLARTPLQEAGTRNAKR